jgi:hypothetical protein
MLAPHHYPVDGALNNRELLNDQLRISGSIDDPTSLRTLLDLFDYRLCAV